MVILTDKELFIKAFEESEFKYYSSIKDITWQTSKEYENKMNSLIKKNNRIKFSTRANIKRSLIASIIALTVLFTGIMSVSATRLPFIEFVKKVFPKFNEITLSSQSTLPAQSIIKEYTISSISEKYKLISYSKDEFSVHYIWKNNNNEEIAFSQNILDTNFSIDNEHNYNEITINEHTAYYSQDDYGTLLIWTDGNYWFSINADNKSLYEVLKLQKNVKTVK